MSYDLTEYSLPSTFLREFVLKNGCSLEKLAEILQKMTAGKYAHWSETRIVAFSSARELLIECGGYELFEHFIDEYTKHLKTL